MSDLFSMFDEPESKPAPQSAAPVMMSPGQRAELKTLFARLNIPAARGQFALIEELTGTRINAVTELSAAQAHRAILGLRRRAASLGRTQSGSSWDNRDEPTWIDRL